MVHSGLQRGGGLLIEAFPIGSGSVTMDHFVCGQKNNIAVRSGKRGNIIARYFRPFTKRFQIEVLLSL